MTLAMAIPEALPLYDLCPLLVLPCAANIEPGTGMASLNKPGELQLMLIATYLAVLFILRTV